MRQIVAMDAQTLRCQRSVIAAQLRRNRLHISRVRRATRAVAAATERSWRLSERLRKIVVIIDDMCDNNTEPAVRFLQSTGRHRGWPTPPDVALHLLVETTFVNMVEGMGATAVAALVSLTSPSDAVAMRDAQRWADEWCVFSWAKRQNVERGVTPSTRQLLAEMSRALAVVGRAPHTFATQSKVRQWGTAFRRRWGGRYGALPAKDCVPLGEMRTKAVTRPCSGWCSAYTH